MNKAVIDLGTNTFNLIIASVSNRNIEVKYTTKEGVALGMGGINDGYIHEDAIQRAVSCLKHFKQACDEWNVSEIKAIGTSAIRDAKNGQAFQKLIEKETGITIEIIDGLREAALIYKGISYTCPFEKRSVIMDIGGGSTEFIIADKNGMENAVSLNIGVSRIFQLFKFQDPLNQTDIWQIEHYLERESQGFFDDKQVDVLVGASGSFETFYELTHNTSYPHGFETQTLVFDTFLQTLESIIHSTQAERDVNPFIIPIRKKMAPIAAVKTRWVIRKLGVKSLVISPCSLKEGALLE